MGMVAPWASAGNETSAAEANRRAFAVTGFFYVCVFALSVVQLVRNCKSYAAWTQQKVAHAILVLLALTRAVFLLAVGVNDWCHVAGTGVLSPACEANGIERQLFYAADELPNLLFFSLYLLMGLFWAEVYYNATDQVDFFSYVVKPTAMTLHVCAYILQIALWVLYADPWRSEDHYIGRGYAAYTTTMFSIVTLAFLVYGRLAYIELRSVPVDLGVRSKKLKEVTRMTVVCTTCFTSRSLLVIYLAQDHVQLGTHLSWGVILLFYALLELLPIGVILHFHRRFPRPSTTSVENKVLYRFLPDDDDVYGIEDGGIVACEAPLLADTDDSDDSSGNI
ncbi:hypothetical protein SDRG_09549 [Saprolegnia diclina VS20]|uniref:THH1/TOM1/TOM3 domain-containing protein n=1 Tax=Saprolegnia diclina (strain VS20) TaxID=1156394 RepID=T0Q5C3_SAPDV|nr:hypothetical protein SDRG_09549 [Saprolegnia diclina VS20]EQC33029.1 hypothetical protein SDRG_09549 [Saprolegnia diclina VS20]|eukprot:XP_008613715.1 hypothetical protein SDRG_09549 [Saprolegnia diclina VS20]